MLSITDLLDFIDLDMETVQVVIEATRLPVEEAKQIARQLLATEEGITMLHHMFRDQIADASAKGQPSREKTLHRAYAYFARKYPIPQLV